MYIDTSKGTHEQIAIHSYIVCNFHGSFQTNVKNIVFKHIDIRYKYSISNFQTYDKHKLSSTSFATLASPQSLIASKMVNQVLGIFPAPSLQREMTSWQQPSDV